jgi:peptidoglycan/xylan/chitin deacetylase (PgdA/CDA1 family)/ketosteroid isomerase-like protein
MNQMILFRSGMRRFALGLALLVGTAIPASAERPILITVDDLPIAGGRFHPDPEERKALTRDLLDVLARHQIQAVGLVTWHNRRGEEETALLEQWLEAGHELGNHSYRHLSYTSTDIDEYIEDIDQARAALAELLEPHDQQVRFFRFPMLREGDTTEKLLAMRAYLKESSQRNLHVTIDNQDWSFEEPWLEAVASGDEDRIRAVGDDFQAAMRLSVRHHERTSDRLFDREVAQILLLHANAVGAAQWDRLFTWLRATGHRFAGADEVLRDPAFAEPHEYVGPRGPGLWDRILVERQTADARREVEEVLQMQAAAWSRGDLDTFCSVYADDALFVSTSGLTQGREEILGRYQAKYKDRKGMGQLTLEVIQFEAVQGAEISMLGDARPSRIHGASVAARWRLSYPDREGAEGLTLLVFRNGRDGWKITQDASM